MSDVIQVDTAINRTFTKGIVLVDGKYDNEVTFIGKKIPNAKIGDIVDIQFNWTFGRKHVNKSEVVSINREGTLRESGKIYRYEFRQSSPVGNKMGFIS